MKNFKPRLAINGVFAGFINEETNLLDDRGVEVYYGDRVMYKKTGEEYDTAIVVYRNGMPNLSCATINESVEDYTFIKIMDVLRINQSVVDGVEYIFKDPDMSFEREIIEELDVIRRKLKRYSYIHQNYGFGDVLMDIDNAIGSLLDQNEDEYE